jgi:oligopeptide transport system substrate-binding protein
LRPGVVPVLTVLPLLLACASGCAEKPSLPAAGSVTAPAVAGSKTPGVLRYALTDEPTTLDPATMIDVNSGTIVAQIYDGLYGINEKNEVEPHLAATLPEVSADGKTYTVTLRPGVTFSDGKPVTAEDVRYTYARALNPAINSPWAMMVLDDLAGAREVSAGKASDFPGVTVVDPRTVRFTLVGPRPYFLVKAGRIGILSKAAVEAGPKNERGVPTVAAENSVGAGPFVLKEYVRQQRVVLEANPKYWAGPPKLTRIERPIVLDTKAARNLYESDELDLLTPNLPDFARDRADPALKDQAKSYPDTSLTYLEMSPKVYAPFRDKRVRQAVALAVDRAPILDAVIQGVGKPATDVLAPGLPGHDPKFVALPYDVARAKKLLGEAGYGPGKPLPPFVLTYRANDPTQGRLAQVLKEQWAQAGITADLREVEWGTLLKNENELNYHANLMGWSAGYLDPNSVVSALFRSDSPQNLFGYDSPAFDKLCRAADAEPDPKRRLALYRQAIALALDDAPMVPLYFRDNVEMVKPYVSGLRDSLSGRLPHTTTAVR